MPQVLFTKRAMRDIRKLPKEIRQRIEFAMGELFHDAKAGDMLHGDWKGYRKLRAGDYRIIYKIKDRSTVEIQYIRHRRHAYQR
jgi:mRNA interferase RelE/StbE